MTSQIVAFRQMSEGTREDYELLDRSERAYATGLPERVMAALRKLDDSVEGFQVTRLEHSLQAATRARRDGADDEYVVAALVHDIGDDLSPYNHAEVAAGILRPFVRPEVTWVIEKHEIFQRYYYAHLLDGDRNARDQFADHPWYGKCADFCERWDQSSFDPDYDWEPLSAFEPLVRKIFTRA